MAASTLTRVVRQMRAAPPLDVDVPDRDLLNRYLRRKDEAAFTSLVRRHERTVLASCRHVLADPADVADAFQATFLVLLRNARRVTWHSSLGGWLFAVAHRVAVSARRKAQVRTEKEGRAAARAVPVEAPPDLSWREACDVLHEELDRLRDTYRLPLLLCYLDGLPRDEAARRLGVTTDAVRGRLDRGREKLRARLARRGVTLSAGLLAALASSAGAAGRRPDLVGPTVAAAAGGPAPRVADLMHEVSPRALASKVGIALTVALVVLLPIGTGVGQRQVGAGEQPDGPKTDPPPRALKKEEAPLRVRVLSPDGKPLEKVKLVIIGPKDGPSQIGTTGIDGRFAFNPPRDTAGYLVARADCVGIDFIEMSKLATETEVELRTVADLPVRGRVIDTEGKPVAGASVRANQFGAFAAGSLKPLLDEWKKLNSFSGRPAADRTMWQGVESLFAAETDKNGRFEFRGVGAERFLVLRTGKSGFTDRDACIANRKGLDAKSYNPAGASWLLYGPDPTIVVEREKPIRGRVTEQGTGKPRAGVHVILSRRERGDLIVLPVGAWTDKDGDYEIRGARKAGGYMVEVKSDSATGHMACQGSSDDSPGYDPITINLEVKKGVIITGRMFNKGTGKPVVGHVMAGVLSDNPFVKDYPTFDSSAWFRMHETDKEGRFRVVAIPGPIILMGGPNSWEETKKYKRPIRDPKYPKYFPKDFGDHVAYYTTGGVITPVQGCFGKVLEIKADAKEIEHDIDLEPANNVTVAVRDADGKPVKGALVAGQGELFRSGVVTCDGDVCPVYYLEPAQPRLVVFHEPKRKLLGALTLMGNEKDQVVKLGAPGSAKGRLLDADGQPVTGAVVEVRYTSREARDMHAAIHKETRVVTGKDGAFTLDGLIPGAEFDLWQKQGTQAKLMPGKSRRVQSGEQLDLGDLK